MATKSRRVANINGAGVGLLKSVASIDTSKGFAANAVKSAKADLQAATRLMLDTIKQFIADSDLYQLALDAKQTDITLSRIASLLDEFKESFTETELALMKEEILDEISGISFSSAIKNFLLTLISSLFDESATKDDIEELKAWMQKNISVLALAEETSAPDSTNAESIEPLKQQKEEDEEKDGYKNSTPAENFANLQSFVQGQFDTLNENLKNIPGQSGILSKFGKMMSAGFFGIVDKVSSIGKLVAKGTSKVFGSIGSVSKLLGKGIFGAISGIAVGVAALGKGLKGVVSGIGSIGSKIGKAVTSPFRAIGGFFSRLNPFKKSDKKEDKKQKLRDRIMDKISKVVEKMWKVIEPLIDKVVLFMTAMFFSVIVPVALIAANVLLIVAAIAAIGIGLYLAYKWVTAKVKQFLNYVMSGELWKDIQAKLVEAWEWLKDFSGWLWNKFLDFGKWYLKLLLRSWKFLLVDIPVWIGKKLAEFGVWVWKKLCEFGKWLYDNYIDKYVILPLAKLILPLADIWVQKILPVVLPFIDSLTNLKDKIVQAFSAWDTSKSIWDNLKNIGGIIKDSVIEWWNESPFKAFYEQYILPFVISAADLFNRLKNLGGFIKQAILDWWNGDSSLGETLSNIGTTVWNTIKEWWDTSIFKEYWEKLKIYLSDMMLPIKEWYDQSSLKIGIDTITNIIKKYVVAPLKGLSRKLMSFLVLLSNMSISLPTGIRTEKKMGIPIPVGFEWTAFYPLGGIKNKLSKDTIAQAEADAEKSPTELIKEEMDKMQTAIDDAANPKNKVDFINQNQALSKLIAALLIQLAAAPIQAMEADLTQALIDIAKTSQEVASGVEKKEASNQEYIDAMMQKTDAIFSAINGFREETSENFKKPNEHLIVAPVGPVNNDAMMASF